MKKITISIIKFDFAEIHREKTQSSTKKYKTLLISVPLFVAFCEITYFNWETTIKTTAIKASKRPIIFSLVTFSLKTKTPTRVPITITPIFIPAKTVEGFLANA